MSRRDYPQPHCIECGVFVNYDADQYTPFGTKSEGYYGPEPYDAEYLCDKHSEKLYRKLLAGYKDGRRSGDWQKSRAEIRAAKEAGLEWIHSSGLVDLRTERDVNYQYIVKSERKFYQPYLDWHKAHPKHDFWLKESPNCRRCGADWKTAHTQGTEYCHQYQAIKEEVLYAPTDTLIDKKEK